MAITPVDLQVTNITATSARLRWVNALQALINSLFSASEQGAFYIPQPIVLGTQALFQDAAGTVPVTADGDPDGLMIDQSPNSNNATQSVSADRPVYEVGSVRESLAFNGNNSALDTGVSRFIWSESWSVSIWCYFNDDSRGILLSNYEAGSSSVGLEKAASRRLRIYYTGNSDIFTRTNVVSLNAWNHCVFVRDVLENNFRIYVDKILVLTFSGLGTFSGDGLETILMGRDIRTGNTTLNGNIGNTVIVDKVLSQLEIDNLYDFR